MDFKVGAIAAVVAALLLAGCANRVAAPRWSSSNATTEKEYEPYLKQGTATVSGQVFMSQRNGGVVKGAGRLVTLDPATTTGDDWWMQAGRKFQFRHSTPVSENFSRARRKVTTDAEGRFKFSDVPAGRYYVKSEVTWEIGGYHPTQGGVVGQAITVSDGAAQEVSLSTLAN